MIVGLAQGINIKELESYGFRYNEGKYVKLVNGCIYVYVTEEKVTATFNDDYRNWRDYKDNELVQIDFINELINDGVLEIY